MNAPEGKVYMPLLELVSLLKIAGMCQQPLLCANEEQHGDKRLFTVSSTRPFIIRQLYASLSSVRLAKFWLNARDGRQTTMSIIYDPHNVEQVLVDELMIKMVQNEITSFLPPAVKTVTCHNKPLQRLW